MVPYLYECLHQLNVVSTFWHYSYSKTETVLSPNARFSVLKKNIVKKMKGFDF